MVIGGKIEWTVVNLGLIFLMWQALQGNLQEVSVFGGLKCNSVFQVLNPLCFLVVMKMIWIMESGFCIQAVAVEISVEISEQTK